MLLKKEKTCLGNIWKRAYFNDIPYSCEGCRITRSNCSKIPVLITKYQIGSLTGCCLLNKKIIYVKKDVYYAIKERINLQ